MAKDIKYFNCSQKHEIDYLAGKFLGPKEKVVAKIKELCKALSELDPKEYSYQALMEILNPIKEV